jgi:hypothetical protein
MLEIKLLNLSLFQKMYVPTMSAYKIQLGKYSPQEADLLRKAIDKLKSDLDEMVSRSVVMPSNEAALPIEFEAVEPSQSIEIPKPQFKRKANKPSIVDPEPFELPKEPIKSAPLRTMGSNIEPYKFAERPVKTMRKSIMNWSVD